MTSDKEKTATVKNEPPLRLVQPPPLIKRHPLLSSLHLLADAIERQVEGILNEGKK